jgi:hypothetical protein
VLSFSLLINTAITRSSSSNDGVFAAFKTNSQASKPVLLTRFPSDVNLLRIDGAYFVMLPTLQSVYERACVTRVHAPSFHGHLARFEILRFLFRQSKRR